MRKRIAAIINPVSGRRDMMPTVHRIAGEIRRAGGTLDLLTTERFGHATILASNLDVEVEAVLVVGGDGTVCEVVNGLVDRPLPFAILRTGTENLLARELGMPTEPPRVARTLLQGEPIAVDVGVINNRRFLAVASAGFDAECVLRLSMQRKGHITHWDYFWPIWRSFWAHRFPTLRIDVDEERVFEGKGLAIFGVIGRYSVGMRVLNRARMDDGLLDICIFPCRSRRGLLAHIARVFCGRHLDGDHVIYRQCKKINITSPSIVPVQVDGEAAGRLPAECSIVPHAIRVLKMRSSDGQARR